MERREDDFETRHAHLAGLTEAELYDRFWSLCGQLVDPMLDMGREYTSPAIERSVLLCMGFSSLEAKTIVAGCVERSLLGHGAGNVVYRLSARRNMTVRDAGAALAAGNLWGEAAALFEGGKE
jgi:D-ornithine 4,5-aminomutase subunit alpha